MTEESGQGQSSAGGGGGQDQPSGVKVDASSLTELKKAQAATTADAVASWLGITPPKQE